MREVLESADKVVKADDAVDTELEPPEQRWFDSTISWFGVPGSGVENVLGSRSDSVGRAEYLDRIAGMETQIRPVGDRERR